MLGGLLRFVYVRKMRLLGTPLFVLSSGGRPTNPPTTPPLSDQSAMRHVAFSVLSFFLRVYFFPLSILNRNLNRAHSILPFDYLSVPIPITRAHKHLPLNDVQATGRLHDARHLAGLERKGGFLKGLLHVAFAKVAQVAPLTGTAAVGLGDGQLGQRLLLGLDDLLVVYLDDVSGLGLGAGDFVLRGVGRGTRQHTVCTTQRIALLISCPGATVAFALPWLSFVPLPNHARPNGQRFWSHACKPPTPPLSCFFFFAFLVRFAKTSVRTDFQLEGRRDSLCFTSR